MNPIIMAVGEAPLKRILNWFLALILILVLAFLTTTLIGMSRLKAYRTEMADMQAQAKASGKEARILLDAGSYDLKIVIKQSLLQKVLGELKGMENTSSKGNRIVIRDVQLSMNEGFVKLEAEADFHWRLGWYRGPVKAVYYGFTRLLDDGRCQLDLRIAEAHPMNNTLLSGPWVESWLVLKLQEKLKFPELTLPLSIEREFDIPDVVKETKNNQLTITVPGRHLPLQVKNPYVLVSPEALTLLIGDLSFDNHEEAQTQAAMPIMPVDGDLLAAFRFSLLEDTLAQAVLPDKDVLISAEFMPDVWKQNKRVLGIKVKNRADLHNLSGHLNITKAALIPSGERWFMELVANGEVFGTVKGKAYGISATVPFHASPVFEDKVPVRFENGDNGIMIVFEDHPLVLDLKIVAQIAGRSVTINHAIETSTQELFQPISIPDWYQKDVKIPVRIEKKKVVETRMVEIKAVWNVNLPKDHSGAIYFQGVLDK